MNKKREKLKLHARTKYMSSPVEFTDAELDAIEKNGYECCMCRKSVFQMDDYPAVRDGSVYCEDCYCEEVLDTCPLCEEHYDPADLGDGEYFFITPSFAKTVHKPVGMYRVLEHPFFYGNCVTGFDDFYDGAIEQVSDFDIEAYLRKVRQRDDITVGIDIICPDCAKKYLEMKNENKD